MENVLPIVGAVSLLLAVPVLLHLRRLTRGTTLTTAWLWAVAAWMTWESAWLLMLSPLPPAVFDHLWYAAALLALCPPIAVLGAKRPGSRVWAMFVVAPLLLVFAWPAVVGWVHGYPPERLQLETPMQLGYCLVLLMGFGNYIGTRQTLPSLLIGFALGGMIFQFSGSPEEKPPFQPIFPTLVIVTAGMIATFTLRRSSEYTRGWEAIWQEYQHTFGLVWAKRFMDRINHTADQEHWHARLEPGGFHWQQNITPEQTAETQARIDHAFRWLLRRFVDPEWIEERL